jgi:penicillin-binding protein 1A
LVKPKGYKFKIKRTSSNKRPPGRLEITLKRLFIAGIFLAIIGFSTVAGIFVYFSRDLPKLDKLSDYRPHVKTKIYSADNELIGEYYVENREVVDIDQVPEVMINALIAAEDSSFFEHMGIDFISIIRAAIANIRAGGVVQGASTITQQVAKTFLLSSDRRLKRKIKEAILASRIEKKFTKKEILHLYLNQIFFGHNSFGIKVAAKNYFNKEVEDLNIAESALLAALPKAPTSTSPFVNPKKARNRQLYVLRRMKAEGFISESEYESAKEYELKLKEYVDITVTMTPYFTEHIRRYLKSEYGDDAVYKDGLTVYTTVNSKLQKEAQEAVQKGIIDLDRRIGYRGAGRHLESDEIDEFIEATAENEELAELELGKVYRDSAVVTKVDDKNLNVTIKLGAHEGVIDFEDLKWARKPNPEVPFYAPDLVKKPSEIFKKGDVIDIKIVEDIEEDEEKDEDKKKKKDEEEGDEIAFKFALYQEPEGQAAIVSMDVHSGFVNVMVGGYDFKKSEFNRATQAERLPGSAFKPIIYAAAVDWESGDGKHYTPSTIIYDTAHVFEDGKWKPSNYSNKFKGAMPLRKALAKSKNVLAVKVLIDIGVDYVKKYAKNLGIKAYINPDPTAALGSSAMKLIELSSVYGIFASGGLMIEPVFVTKVEDRFGNVLEEYVPFEDRLKGEKLDENGDKIVEEFDEEEVTEAEYENIDAEELLEHGEGEPKDDPRRVMSASTAYIINNLLQSVVQEGTGWRLKKAFGNIPLAGKTGTTNDFIDAWFMGYSPDIVTGVWVGFDEEHSMGKSESGSRAAAPIWVDYMKEALKGVPVKSFPVPDDIEFIKIDPKTGLLARPGTKDAKFECFKKGTVPTEYTDAPDDDRPDDFFIEDMEEEIDYRESKNNLNHDTPIGIDPDDDELDETIPVAIP